MKHLTDEFVKSKLKLIGSSMLKNQYKKMWTEDNPTLGYCYIVSEAIYHYTDKDVKSYCLNCGELGVHWWLVVDTEIIDYTAEQFTSKGLSIDYSKGVHKKFYKGSVKTKKGYISKRGYEMSKLLNLV